MTYLISDIHGEADRFFQLLELIQLKEADTLYVLGDVVDRGPDGISILQHILSHQNQIQMILGNHEFMFYDAITHPDDPYKQFMWERNGGYITYEKFYSLPDSEKNKILDFIENIPDQVFISKHDQEILLVHGCPGETREDRIWNRPDLTQLPLLDDTVVIVGHTPTALFRGGEIESPLSIYYNNKFIGLDCGCGHSTRHRRLACLRLDDMREFYV